jgi:toxin secretion/phage lysis holin
MTIDKWTLATIVIVLFDIALGFIKAWVLNNFTSKKARRGVAEHFSVISALILASFFTQYFNYNAILNTLEAFLILSYSASIVKNFKRIGAPIPSFLEKLLDAELNKYKEVADDDKKRSP